MNKQKELIEQTIEHIKSTLPLLDRFAISDYLLAQTQLMEGIFFDNEWLNSKLYKELEQHVNETTNPSKIKTYKSQLKEDYKLIMKACAENTDLQHFVNSLLEMIDTKYVNEKQSDKTTLTEDKLNHYTRLLTTPISDVFEPETLDEHKRIEDYSKRMKRRWGE